MTDYNDDSRALMQRFNVVGPPTRRIRVASQSVFSQSVLKWVVAAFEELLKDDPDIDHWTTYVGQGAVRASSCENRGMSGYGMAACGAKRTLAGSSNTCLLLVVAIDVARALTRFGASVAVMGVGLSPLRLVIGVRRAFA